MSNTTQPNPESQSDEIEPQIPEEENKFSPDKLNFISAEEQFKALFPGFEIHHTIKNVIFTIHKPTNTAIVVYPPGGIPVDDAQLMIDSFNKLLEYGDKGYTMMSYQPHNAKIPSALLYMKAPMEAMRLGIRMLKRGSNNRMVVVTTSLPIINNLRFFFESMVVVYSNNPMVGTDFIRRFDEALNNPVNVYDSPKETYARVMLESRVPILGPGPMISYLKGQRTKPFSTEDVLE